LAEIRQTKSLWYVTGDSETCLRVTEGRLSKRRVLKEEEERDIAHFWSFLLVREIIARPECKGNSDV